MAYPRRRKVGFWATEYKRVPTRVNFTTWEGKRVSFRATKTIRRDKWVSFYKKRKKW